MIATERAVGVMRTDALFALVVARLAVTPLAVGADGHVVCGRRTGVDTVTGRVTWAATHLAECAGRFTLGTLRRTLLAAPCRHPFPRERIFKKDLL